MPRPQNEDTATAFAVIVNDAVLCPPAVSVNCAGLKLQLMPTGSPEQLRLTASDIPPTEARFTVTGDEVSTQILRPDDVLPRMRLQDPAG
jgi:hypothetical protein